MLDFVMLIGLSGSGKDSYTEYLKKSKPYTVISRRLITEVLAKETKKPIDEIIRSEGVYDYDSLIEEQIATAIKNNENIIVNKAFLTKPSREEIRSLVPENYTSIGIVFNIPIDVVTSRLQKLEKETGIRTNQKLVEIQRNRFALPDPSEFDEIVTVDETWSPND